MTDFLEKAKRYRNAENMASDFLKEYFCGREIIYPINPFKILKDLGIVFLLRDFKKLEGLYIPSAGEADSPLVGINYNRPITRQRFTAAHELCHHLRDSDKEFACAIGERNELERFADNFASAILMPINELRREVNRRRTETQYISFDDVLEIADYFGVSFEACLFRIAYLIHAIDGNVESFALKLRIKSYKPDLKRKEKNMNFLPLYEGLINSYENCLSFEPNDHAKYVFQNDYIYNDSRMEGLNVEIDQASEIVSDLRLNQQNSKFCSEENEVFLSIAGHYLMYQDIFELPVKANCSFFDSVGLNRKLFSYYPHPEAYGGNFRQSNAIVTGSKFETTPYHLIFDELMKVDEEIKELVKNRKNLTIVEYIKSATRIHHKLTVIHPYSDGNGRTLRAFFNVLLIKGGVCPLYIKAEEKDEYLSALSSADTTGCYDALYECIYRILIRSSVELSKN